MEKRHYVCIGVAAASLAAIACILSQKKCRDKITQACHEGKKKMGKCCSKKKEKHCCKNEEKAKKVNPNGMGEETDQPYYSETYYVNDQKEEE